MRFDRVLVMGANKIACDCTALLAKKLEANMVSVLETALPTVSMLFKLAHKFGLEYINITDAELITEYLTEYVRNKKVLIISANNRYIFRDALISQPNVEIINFHYALLPAYRGMNIPTWVIYNGEFVTGITWHYVTKKIDCGNIISQRSMVINETTTAFEIVRTGMQMAQDAFASFYEELLEKKIKGREVVYPQDGKVYKARELPDNGYLDLNKPFSYISRLLRSYDYRGLDLMPKLRLLRNGKEYIVDKYSIIQGAENFGTRIEKNVTDNIMINEGSMQIIIGLVPIEI